MTDAQKKVAELKAANAVRRVIQKVRLATPDTFEKLEAEVFDCMEQQLTDMGSQHEKVQEEVEKALEVGRKRVQQIQEKRAKEAEAAARPKELIEEIKALMESLQAKVTELKTQAGIEPATQLKLEEAPAVRKLTEECTQELKEFSTQCVTRAKEIKDATLPEMMKAEWTQLAAKIVEVKKKGEAAVMQAKGAVNKATEAQRKQMLEAKKKELKAKLEDATMAVPAAEQYVITAEMLVEPFVTGKKKEEAELTAICPKVDEAVAVAKSSIDAARQDMQHPVSQDVDMEDELLKKEIEAFLAAEQKRPQLRLGQMLNRLNRVSNIVARHQKEIRTVKNKELLVALKDELLEKVKANGESKAAEEAEPTVKAAEKEIEPLFKTKGLSILELRSMAEKAQAAVDFAKEALSAASYEVCPIDESLDADLKKKLKALAQPHVKKPFLRLGQMERRMVRVVNLLATFRNNIAKKKGSELAQVQSSVQKVLRHHLATKAMEADALFAELSGGAVSLDKSKFLAFFQTADKTVKKDGSEETEEVQLPDSELEALFSSLLANGAAALSKASFSQLVSPRMTVVKATTLTSVLSIADSKILRALKAGEALEALEGPVKEDKAGVMRVRVKSVKDGKMGWATVAGNAGSVFLKVVGPQ